MPGYLGGGGGQASGGVGGEIKFPKEFIDPVTKLRVSNPQNLIDTDFEYGLQPTKWETVELINNTPSFFSKSGDTTIDGINSITTNAGTREITVRTALEHGLAVGIPINVQGTKSTTAEGSYIINSIPDEFTFTYLAKDTQSSTSSINDLYSSVITGEFFQGSQLRISSIVTDAATPISELTVTTQSTHGFGPSTPFYFLNLNSTIAQEFPASNTEIRSFDSSNSATAQTFDGSNTLSSINIDLSNSATSGGFPSTVTSGVDPNSDTIEVTHPTQENFAGLKVGQALYYDINAGSGFFQANPRGVVFLLTTDGLGEQTSTFQVSEIPNGNPVNITGAMTGTFQIANQARTFAGNNINPDTEVTLGVVDDDPKVFDAANENGTVAVNPTFDGTNQFSVLSQSGNPDIDWQTNTMVRFDTDGNAPSGLVNGETYFINQRIQNGNTNQYFIRISEFPNQTPIQVGTNGSGNATFTQIGLSLTKDIINLPNHNFQEFDMLKYTYPDGGRFVADEIQDFYFVQTVYDSNNFSLTHTLGEITPQFQSFGPIDYGEEFLQSAITIVGFEAPYTFAVTEGVLPAGLTLNTTTGVVSGTPSEVYDNQVVITMTDTNGSQDTQTIKFEFTQPPFLYDFSSATFTPGGRRGRTGPNLTEARSGLGNPSWANNSEFFSVPSRGIQRWTVPQSATYRFTVRGGGRSGRNSGRGAIMRADIPLQQGEQLEMAVGHRPPEFYTGCASGGAGGSFVTKIVSSGGQSTSWGTQVVPLIVAGGGGGPVDDNNRPSRDASTTTYGAPRPNWANYGGYANGGTQGYGGNAYASVGGGGFRGNGSTSTQGNVSGNNRNRAFGFYQGATGSSRGNRDEGGFGGGGQSTCDRCDYAAHAGAGGGYSGGAGGSYTGGPCYGGASGGGSFVVDTATNVFTSNGSFTRYGNEGFPTYSGNVSGSLGWNTTDGSIQVQKL